MTYLGCQTNCRKYACFGINRIECPKNLICRDFFKRLHFFLKEFKRLLKILIIAMLYIYFSKKGHLEVAMTPAGELNPTTSWNKIQKT